MLFFANKLTLWMEENLPEGLAVLKLPAAHQRRMRTSNALERVNMQSDDAAKA